MSTLNSNPLTNGSYWGPIDEAPADILLEKLFLASGWIVGLTCGMQFIIYLLCIRVLFTPNSSFSRTQISRPSPNINSNSKNSSKTGSSSSFFRIPFRIRLPLVSSSPQRRLRRLTPFTLFLLTYSTLLCIVNILYTGSSYVALQLTFIEFRNFPGGPIGFLGVEAPLKSNVMSITMLVLSSVMSDALLWWRCRLIWRLMNDGWWIESVLAIPGLMVLASFGMGMLWNITIASPSGLYSTLTAQYGLIYFSLSLSTNLLLTLLIVSRIYTYQLHLRRTIGRGHGYDGTYTSISAMFVESSMLSCAGSLFLLVTEALNSSINQVGIGFAPAFQVISTYLIILRVAQGRAWSSATINNHNQGANNAPNRPRPPNMVRVMEYDTTDYTTTTTSGGGARGPGGPSTIVFTSTPRGGTNVTDFSDGRDFEMSEFERSSGNRIDEEKFIHA